MYSTNDIINKGYACLVEHLGIIDTEHFIAEINRKKIDYTLWRQTIFDGMTLDEACTAAAEYAEKCPHQSNGKEI